MSVELEKNGPAHAATILVIDDDETVRFSLSRKFTKYGYNVISADKAEDALYLLKTEKQKVDFVITDIRLRKMDGIELLRHVNGLENPVPVLLTGSGNIEDAVNALRYGACDFIRKPFDVNEVAATVRSVLKRREEERLALDVVLLDQQQPRPHGHEHLGGSAVLGVPVPGRGGEGGNP